MKRTDPPIIVSTNIDSNIESVWSALTVRDEMVQWYFEDILEFKAEIGFRTQFSIEIEGRKFTHLWEVLAVQEKKLLTCRWQFEEYAGDSTVTFQINESDNGLRVDVIVKVLEDFPDDLPEFKTESCIAGWNYFIGEALLSYLGSKC